MPRPNALILGTKGGHNSAAHYEPLAGLLVGPGGLSLTVRDDFPDQTEASLAGFDLLILWSGGPRPPFPQAATEAVLATARRGTPLLVLHAGCYTTGKAVGGPEAAGAAYQSPHLPIQEISVAVVDRQHPITTGVEDFRITDEPYRLDVVGEDVRVLCTFDARKAEQYAASERPAEQVEQIRAWSQRTPQAPLVYVKRLGAGKLCLNALGHSPAALANPGFRQLMLQTIPWLLE
jgi:hypothetical protein